MKIIRTYLAAFLKPEIAAKQLENIKMYKTMLIVSLVVAFVGAIYDKVVEGIIGGVVAIAFVAFMSIIHVFFAKALRVSTKYKSVYNVNALYFVLMLLFFNFFISFKASVIIYIVAISICIYLVYVFAVVFSKMHNITVKKAVVVNVITTLLTINTVLLLII